MAALDTRLASLFRRASAAGDADELRADQLAWLRWRDHCRADTRCLYRRYEQRVRELQAVGAPPRGETGSASPGGRESKSTRLVEGRFERVLPDGTIAWTAVDGSGSGMIFADGSESVTLRSQAVPPTFPGFPPNGTAWAAALESNMLGIIDAILPPADRAAYRAFHAGVPQPARIDRHVRAIRILIGD
nr:hypothetical protein [uncultured Jannaschia sp.]